jgi:integrase
MPALAGCQMIEERAGAASSSGFPIDFPRSCLPEPFGPSGKPFHAAAIYRRADRAWAEAGLGRLRLHQARHTYASFMIAAGVNAKALSSFMGHSSIKVTFDLYGHLMPGTEPRLVLFWEVFVIPSGCRERGRPSCNVLTQLEQPRLS